MEYKQRCKQGRKAVQIYVTIVALNILKQRKHESPVRKFESAARWVSISDWRWTRVQCNFKHLQKWTKKKALIEHVNSGKK